MRFTISLVFEMYLAYRLKACDLLDKKKSRAKTYFCESQVLAFAGKVDDQTATHIIKA